MAGDLDNRWSPPHPLCRASGSLHGPGLSHLQGLFLEDARVCVPVCARIKETERERRNA